MRLAILFAVLLLIQIASAEPRWPPQLNYGAEGIGVQTNALLTPPETLREGVIVAKQPPAVWVTYYPGQNYEGNPWSAWGDGLFHDGVYYSAIGDHKSPGGNALLYAYDAKQESLRQLMDVRSVLDRPDGHYTPGKIHSELGIDDDGWIYFSTHRGSTRVGLDPKNKYNGDWIMRHHPQEGRTEILATNPLPMQSLPMGTFDPKHRFWYAGTADGLKKDPPQFLVYDVDEKEIVYTDKHGPYRAVIRTKSGIVYLHGKAAGPERPKGAARLSKFDPESPGPPQPIDAEVGLRCATHESSDGIVYTADGDSLWAFDSQTETARHLGPTAVASQTYIASIDLDPQTERYLYYIPGAHGGGYRDGAPVVQYDLKTNTRKVLCFLAAPVHEATGFLPMGTYAIAVSDDGAQLFVTWNGNQGTPPEALPTAKKVRFNSCALTVIDIPASERSND